MTLVDVATKDEVCVYFVMKWRSRLRSEVLDSIDFKASERRRVVANILPVGKKILTGSFATRTALLRASSNHDVGSQRIRQIGIWNQIFRTRRVGRGEHLSGQ